LCDERGGERRGLFDERRLWRLGVDEQSRAGQGRRRIWWVMKKKRSIKNGNNNNRDEYSCVLCRH
jgi:hypothetical protein